MKNKQNDLGWKPCRPDSAANPRVSIAKNESDKIVVMKLLRVVVFSLVEQCQAQMVAGETFYPLMCSVRKKITLTKPRKTKTNKPKTTFTTLSHFWG